MSPQRSGALGGFLRPEGYDGPRGLAALSREGSTAVEVARHLAQRRAGRRDARTLAYAGPHRRAAVEPVLLVPGFMAGDFTLRGMSDALRAAGFRTYRSQIRVNVGCTRDAADRLERRLEAIAVRRDRKVSIVGHSLGGMLARGLAARRPDLVAGIVTLGSPVLAPAAVHRLLVLNVELLNRLTAAGLGGLMSADCTSGECARLSFEESHLPLESGVGFTAIYSKRDGVVDWRACLDPAADEQVEVRTSHCGMAVDPMVIERVVHALRTQQAARGAAAATASAQEALRAAAVAPLAARR